MSTTAPSSAPTKKENGFKFGSATLLLVGLVMLGAQFVAVHAFGIAEYVRLGPGSAGVGLLAVIAGSITSAKCRTWESWRKWIWLPVTIAVSLAFIFVGLVAQSIAREEAGIRQEQEFQREEDARQAEIDQSCRTLQQRIDNKAAEYYAELDSYRRHAQSGNAPSWVDPNDPGPFWSGHDIKKQHDEIVAEYNASC